MAHPIADTLYRTETRTSTHTAAEADVGEDFGYDTENMGTDESDYVIPIEGELFAGDYGQNE